MNNMYHKIYSHKLFLFSLLMVALMGLSACQGANPPSSAAVAPVSTSAPAATEAPAQTQAPAVKPAGTEAAISVYNDPTLGDILVGNNGMTLYIFTKDTPDTSNCNAACLQKWPALLTQGHPKLGDGVDASLVGSITLPDGTMMVTYNHMPLYYWYKDVNPGDTLGQDVQSVWYVVSPTGEPIKTKK